MTVDDAETVDTTDFRAWFDNYLDAFAAGAAGRAEFRTLLAFYAAPLTVITDAGVIAMITEQQVSATIRQQLDGLRSQNYSSTTVERFDVSVLNERSALLGATLLRRRIGGNLLESISLTYLIIGSPPERQISVIAVRS